MHRRELARRRKENDFLGAAGSVGGGGGVLLLPELGGAFRWIAGDLVMVKKGSDWVGGGCAGWWRDGSILDRNGCRCLLWRV